MDIAIARSTYARDVAKEPYIPLLNRFFEENPALSDGQVAAIARPALKKFAEVGTGPVRRVYSQPGTFDDDLFVVSGTFLYRVACADASVSTIGQIGSAPLGDVSMAAVANIGVTPAKLFIAEGGVLWMYVENGQARGHLQATGAIANNDVIQIGGIYYQWTNASVNAGSPAGTSGNPWLVRLGATNAEALTGLFHAINASGAPGTDYSNGLTAHPTVRAVAYTAADLYVAALDYGVSGNGISTTETGTNLSWGGTTLADGGAEQLVQVMVPEDNGAISVAAINSYVIVVPVQDENAGTIGRFYWIRPGATTIDPLDFATAERSPDRLHQVKVFGDMFWLLGTTTTEPWVTSGNPDFPMQRFQGILFDRGSWEGTAVQVKDSLIVVDEDGGVFRIAGGQTRISRPDIEERIRLAIQRQKMSGV